MAEYKPDTSIFSDGELGTVDYWIDHIDREHTGRSISEKTHEDMAWQLAKNGEELPLYAVRLARIEEPSDSDVERLKKRAKELGLG